MAQYRGGIKGQHGQVTRLGSKNSGLNVWANTWNNMLDVTLYHKDGKDYARITVAPWASGSGVTGASRELFDGEV